MVRFTITEADLRSLYSSDQVIRDGDRVIINDPVSGIMEATIVGTVTASSEDPSASFIPGVTVNESAMIDNIIIEDIEEVVEEAVYDYWEFINREVILLNKGIIRTRSSYGWYDGSTAVFRYMSIEQAIHEAGKYLSSRDLTLHQQMYSNCKKSCNNVFGTDPYIVCSDEDNPVSRLGLLIECPDVELSNSKGAKHTIRAMWLCVNINTESRLLFGALYGIRSKYTQYEFNAGYSHSHLTQFSGTPDRFHSFCLGRGNVAHMLSSGVSLLNVNELEMFFHVLLAYVGWESLEGGPYYKLHNMGSGALSSISERSDLLFGQRVLSSYSNPLSTRYHSNKYHVELSDDVLSEMANLFEDPKFICKRTSNGKYWNQDIFDRTLSENTILFKLPGREVKVETVQKENGEDVNRLYPHPVIVKSFKRKINEQINQTIFKQCSSERLLNYVSEHGLC